MQTRLSIFLKLLAIYLWFYIPVFVLSFAQVRTTAWGEFFVREAQITNWEFELLFVLIFAVWAYFIWKTSHNPTQNTFFIDFTIWATIAHIIGMVIIGFVHTSDLGHMLKDAVVPLILICPIIYFRFTHPDSGPSTSKPLSGSI